MTTVGVSVASNEFDAAQALLDLQGNVREINSEKRDATSISDCKEDMEKSAKLFLSCFIASKMDRTTKRITPESDFMDNLPSKIKYREEFNNKRTFLKNNPISQTQVLESNIKVKRDIGTQTEEKYQLPVIQNMELTIQKLCERIQFLEEQIKNNSDCSRQSTEQCIFVDDREDVGDLSHKSRADEDMTMNASFLPDSDVDDELSNSDTQIKDNDPEYNLTQKYKSKKVLRYNSNIRANVNDMVPIGEGNAMIPCRIFRHINWNSYTSATRKLLTAVFSRKVLATHSLTGKPSPAFPNKPAKKKLDSSLINDIVLTVVERCNVPENVVRTSITTKCADESKMFRTRQKNKKKRKYNLNRENIPPGSDSDDV